MSEGISKVGFFAGNLNITISLQQLIMHWHPRSKSLALDIDENISTRGPYKFAGILVHAPSIITISSIHHLHYEQSFYSILQVYRLYIVGFVVFVEKLISRSL
jgi:hypothetical protein